MSASRPIANSVPFTLIGQTVEVTRRGAQLEIRHRGTVVAAHEALPDKYQVRILPEHGPGAIARTARRVRSTLVSHSTGRRPALPEVEIRDLAVYEAVIDPGWGDIERAAPLEIVDREPTLRSLRHLQEPDAAASDPVLAEVTS